MKERARRGEVVVICITEWYILIFVYIESMVVNCRLAWASAGLDCTRHCSG